MLDLPWRLYDLLKTQCAARLLAVRCKSLPSLTYVGHGELSGHSHIILLPTLERELVDKEHHESKALLASFDPASFVRCVAPDY